MAQMPSALSSLGKNVCQQSQIQHCPSLAPDVGLLCQPTRLEQI